MTDESLTLITYINTVTVHMSKFKATPYPFQGKRKKARKERLPGVIVSFSENGKLLIEKKQSYLSTPISRRNSERLKKLSRIWNSMEDEEKRKYNELAKKRHIKNGFSQFIKEHFK